MKSLLLILLLLSLPAGAESLCGGKKKPENCVNGCLENFSCNRGKWVRSLSESCLQCGKRCGGVPEPQICNNGCQELYSCRQGKWEKSPAEICLACGDVLKSVDPSWQKSINEDKPAAAQ